MASKRKVDRPRWDSQHVQALRRHLRLTQSELAERLGLGLSPNGKTNLGPGRPLFEEMAQ